jgi:hypothetical protein
MTPRISIEQIAERERDVLWRYLQFYIYDMSRFTGAQPDNGVFPYRHFDAYWREGERRSAMPTPATRWPNSSSSTAGAGAVSASRLHAS